MDQNYNNSQNDFLWTLLANPADDAYQYNYNLQRLVNDFPQSGILQALLAHSSEEKNLRQASVYFNAKSLYKLINAPSSFIGVSDEKIIQNGARSAGFNNHLQQDTNTDNAENYFSDNTPAETVAVSEAPPAIEHEIPPPVVDEHHTVEAETVNTVETHAENIPAEEHIEISHKHEQVNDIPVIEEPVNTIEELPQPLIAEPEAIAGEHATAGETHEHAEEIEGTVSDIPAAEPIVNYAFGLGHKLPPDTEEAGEMLPQIPAEAHTEETPIAGHEVPQDVSYEHSIEENISDAHLPPPVPAEGLAEPHPADAETPPPVPAEHRIADPVAAEYRGFEESQAHEHLAVAEPAADEHFDAGSPENNELIQQYRPWDEPAAETQQPETSEEPQLTEEYKPWEEAAANYHQPEIKEEYTEEQQPAEEYKPWEESAANYHQPEIKEEDTEEPRLTEEYKPWEESAANYHQPEIKGEQIEELQPAEAYKPWEEAATTYRQAETVEEHIEMPHQEDGYRQGEAATSEIHHTDANAGSHTIEEETFDEITGNIDVEQDAARGTDFFSFDRTFGEHKEPEPVIQEVATTTEPVNEQPGDADQQDLSKYHDEKMPYSFLWWLDKTRKEHSGVYQPYVPSAQDSASERTARPKPGTDELQQQYYENIFHITSVEELDKSVPQPPYTAPAFSEKKKEQQIIERFIQEEPQIRPQSSDKLDNENKAKKSSEDRDELVSETLAAIYSDQMLYHKAIASYKKLMLRFPEKSRYFAAKIEQLEKKTN